MITIKNVESPVVITDANNVSSPISKYAGETYTCIQPVVPPWTISNSFLLDGVDEYFINNNVCISNTKARR